MNTIDQAYERFCKKRFPLPSEYEIATKERAIGVRFPQDYREFILEFNGGYFYEPGMMVHIERPFEDALRVMYGLGASHPSAELASEASLALFDDNNPPLVIPIGYTVMGNLIFITEWTEATSRVYIKLAGLQKYVCFAEDIQEFFELLRLPDDNG